MPVDTVLYGEFDKYTLVERENITIDNSEHVRFVEDQMAFRGKGRFDGKPTKPEAFALVTITPAI
jgi:HK97 family phage major capsid protein